MNRILLMKRIWRMLRWLIGVPLALVVLVAVGGAIWNAWADARDAGRLHPPGQLVDVGGLRLHLYCTGTDASSPTVVLDTGWGMPALGWSLVQPEVAKRARVCSYDRAGMGWSDAYVPTGPRTSGQIAEQLHSLLRAAGVARPYVLVGHSNGGMLVRLFQSRFPDEVVGAVLVDSSTEDMDDLFAGKKQVREPPDLRSAWRREPLLRVLMWTGVVRWQLRARAPEHFVRAVGAAVLEEGIYLMNQPKWYPAAVAELDGMPASYDELHATRGLGDLPLVVLTSGRFVPNGSYSPDEQLRMRRIWLEQIQPPLAKLSVRGRQLVVDSGHMIPIEAPGAVVQAIGDVLEMVKGDRAQRLNTGSP